MMTKRNDLFGNAANFLMLFFFGLVLFQFGACGSGSDKKMDNQDSQVNKLNAPVIFTKPTLVSVKITDPCTVLDPDCMKNNEHTIALTFEALSAANCETGNRYAVYLNKKPGSSFPDQVQGGRVVLEVGLNNCTCTNNTVTGKLTFKSKIRDAVLNDTLYTVRNLDYQHKDNRSNDFEKWSSNVVLYQH